jgi:hypothetical protein
MEESWQAPGRRDEWLEAYGFLSFADNVPREHKTAVKGAEGEDASHALSGKLRKSVQQLLGLVMTGSIRDGGCVTYRGTEAWVYLQKHPKLLCNDVQLQVGLAYLCAREQLGFTHDVSRVIFELLNVVAGASAHGPDALLELMQWKDNRSMKIKIKSNFCDQNFAKESPAVAAYFLSGAGGVQARQMKLLYVMVGLVLLNVYLYMSGVSRFS